MDEHQVRLQKLAHLKDAGVIPYADKYSKTHHTTDLQKLGDDQDNVSSIDTLMESGASQQYRTAGRLMMYRSHGKLSFGTIRDGYGDIQVAWVRGQCHFHTGREVVQELTIADAVVSAYKIVDKYFDVGDFIGVVGELFVTKHGELTLFVDEYQMLSKALRPLGDKWHGIKDEEKQYRQRYLDLTLNTETYERFKFRSDFIRYMREFYRDQGFVEVETPTLGNAASGAAAQPFITYHNDFESDFLLRISPETSLKKATAGRFERVFEIGKQFRNEGSDPSHMQEFTSVEHYAVYRNYEDNMQFTEKMFDSLFQKLGIDPVIQVKDKDGKSKDVDFGKTWERIDYVQGVNQAAGIDITSYSMEDAEQLRADIQAAGHQRVGMEDQGTTTLIDYLYKKVLRPTITGPAFVYNYPKTMQPLARQNDENPAIVEQFQVVVNGREVIKAYSELVDPVIQSSNFDEQSGALAAGDEEATSSDDDFVHAMEYGMPCQSGRGMGIDRIITLITGQDNLRDTVLFPLMKSEESKEVRKEKKEERSDIRKEHLNTQRNYLGELNDLGVNGIVGGREENVMIRKAVRIIAIQDGKIRMIHNGKFDYYGLPGGGVDAGETLENTLHREAHEEGGITLTNPRLLGVIAKQIYTHDEKCFELNYGYIVDVEAEIGTQFDEYETAEEYSAHRLPLDEVIQIVNQQIKDRHDTVGNNTKHQRNIVYAQTEKVFLDEAVKLGYIDKSLHLELGERSREVFTKNELQLSATVDSGSSPEGQQSIQSQLSPIALPPHNTVEALVSKYLIDTKLHCQQVGFVMQQFAKKLGEDEQLRYTAGLLHDIDRDHISKDANSHLGDEFEKIMDELGADDHLRRTIKSHYPDGTGVQPESLIERYLISVDELTGFLYAYARMRPGGYDGLKRKSINKKIKDKSFAAGVERDHLRNCEKYLDRPLNEFALELASLCDSPDFPTINE